MNLAKQVCPDFPEDRTVKESPDSLLWYKIVLSQKSMYVPTTKILKSNPMELDRYIEAVTAFSKVSFDDCAEFDWSPESLHLYQFEKEGCLDGIEVINRLLNAKEPGNRYVACDIETRRVEWEENYLLSIGFATDADTCVALYNIPIKGSQNDKFGHIQAIWNALQALLLRKDVSFIWHNGKFDGGRLKYFCNLDSRVDQDTMLLHYCGINERKGSHGLKELGQLYLQAPAWDDELDNIKRDYCKKNHMLLKQFTYDLIPIEVLIPYMERDCIATYRLFWKFKSLQRPNSYFIYGKLIEASEVYKQVELNGLQIDVDYLEELEYQLDVELNQAHATLAEVSKKIWDPFKYCADTGAKVKLTDEFNPKSPKQLKWMLETVVGYPVASTDAQMLESLLEEAEKGRIDNPLAKEFLESIAAVRKSSKYMDTFVQGTRENLCRDCRIRGTFNLHGTETGRLSSTNPNMQNIPRNKLIKNMYVSKPGTKLVQMDYSQAELRVLAMLSEDPWLINAYQSGMDLHDAVATEMYGPDFTHEQRSICKTINFGIVYGRGPSSISEKFGVSMSEARAIINNWFSTKPKVREFIDERRRMASHGEPCVTIFGRERHFVLTDADLNHIQNEYINTPVQSVASDCTLFSIIEIQNYINDHHYNDDVKIVTNVHDSIILEVKDDEALINEMAKVCSTIMAEVPHKYVKDCPVSFRADVEIGTRWGELEEWDM